jgi:WD40-like Beta Propeller Repeat
MKRIVVLTGLVLLAAALRAAAQGQGYVEGYTNFGQNKIVYGKFDWQIYRSTHFQIYFYSSEKEALGKVASFAESAYDELSRDLNYQISKPIPLIYYATHSDFEQTNTIVDFIPEGIGAFTLPTRDRMVLPIDLPDQKLEQLIHHELTHVFQFEILFQGNFIRAATSSPPTWFMEGMASYFGNDEDNRDRMVLRDAVVADLVPEITKTNIQGYFAYRFGHAVFDFIAAEWGKAAVRDFVFTWRNNLGGNVARVLKRAFDITPEDFDIRFRRYLRKRYLKILAEKGEPVDFGEQYRAQPGNPYEADLSPDAFPSGDFIAAFSTYKNDADVVVFSNRDRKLFKNLTKGYTTRYEYLVNQFVTVGPEAGRDLGVSPDGNTVAVFARKERGRDLLLLNALSGGIRQIVPMDVDQQLSPAFSPDGKKLVFKGMRAGRSDIYVYDIAGKTLTDLTKDDAFDLAPTYSPDGKWIYYCAIAGRFAKIFRVDPSDPAQREQITFGDWNDEDPYVSPDGKDLFFTSDRNGGIYNIYALELASGRVLQYTDVVGGCFTPTVFVGKDNAEQLVFAAYYKLRFQLYITDVKKPFKVLPDLNPAPAPAGPQTTAKYVPAIEVHIDPEKIQKKASKKLFIDDAGVTAGVNSDQTFVSNTYLSFSDNLGNRRFTALLQSVSTYSNVDLSYVNLTKRFQYGVEAFDTRLYYVTNPEALTTPGVKPDTRQYLRQTGAVALGLYPLDRYHRFETSVGYISRSEDIPIALDNNGNVVFSTYKDNFPYVSLGFVGDTTLYSNIGPLEGRRYSLQYQYGYAKGGTLFSDIQLDARHYFRITERSLIAARVTFARSIGSEPNIYYFGGLDTLRGYDYASIFGTEIAYGNFEYRFPLFDAIRLPFATLSNIRGRVFVDVGTSYLDIPGYQTAPYRFWGGKDGATALDPVTGQLRAYRPYELINGLASYGWGFSITVLGLELHWDFARQWDFRKSLSSPQTSFYIGYQF